VSIGAVSTVTSPSSSQSGGHDSVSQLRVKIEQMKEKLAAVKKDPKTDCKTKDWQMQSLQQAIQKTQDLVAAQTVKAKKTEEAAPVKRPDPNDPVKSGGSVGTNVDCYA
jgi:gentisate 1,2-dioxygenase